MRDAMKRLTLAAGLTLGLTGMESGKDTGQDLGKATVLASLGIEETQRRLARHLHEAHQHLVAALGPKAATCLFVDSLFAPGRARTHFPAETPVAGADAARSREVVVN